ncbi:ubiquinone/menaquinone biosynthesis methyltransferase [Gleimia coleocanis DSM 15436]|uniref:Demethylmenaquinone methyltransferase n=1 Tax=Gleimia coleocanis DSM 15436 TaxID=525245 RepID=C0VYW5_9ACTO|nr:class I SAM-dependent methyltransferase [Gleimia coleocanis]EEH64618.1 ubiquinone/menaquinone biosynthesis methyltransferase [Gleimia coleocanis DSM 15436]
MTNKGFKAADVSRATLEKRPEEIAGMFNKVAKRYDLMNEIMTVGQLRTWRKAVREALDVGPGQRVLDLAAGTGASTAALLETGAELVACDLSEGMIEVGRQRHPEIEFVHGNALDLPFSDESFDAVTISFGIRNIPDTEKVLSELARVLKPGGRLVILESSQLVNPTLAKGYRFYLGKVMLPAASWFSSDEDAYEYFLESVLDWHDQEELGVLIKGAGFKHVKYRNFIGGVVAIHRALRR